MGMERGTRKEDVWMKTEGKGQQYGIRLKEELLKAGVISIPDIVEHVASKQGDVNCMGTRKLLNREMVNNGKPIEKLEFGDYEWITYKQVHEKITKAAASFIETGLQAGSRVAILAETRSDWYIAAAGCLRAGLTVVTLYTNLSDSGISHGIEETEVDTIISSYELLPRLTPLLENLTLITKVIVMEDQLEGIGSPKDIPERITLTSFSNFIDSSDVTVVTNRSKPEKHDLAIIMYTSGSTGNPKGVEITHENILWAMLGYIYQADLGPSDRYIAYLPLAHVMELATETSLLAMGVSIIYSSPFTLTNNSPKIKEGTLGDARVGNPTSMNAVPLILDRIYKGVANKVQSGGKLKETIFNEALKFKKNEKRKGYALTSKILDAVIFNKIKAELGGQLRQLVVGGSPLSAATHKTIRAMFGCTLQVGYGATETASSITSMDVDDKREGHCGPPNLGVMIKLADWDEGGYRITDTPRPRGEIVVGGPTVAKGYFKLPDETEKAFYQENGTNWFRTGDIGEFDETGVLYIIDRKKDILKLKHGEYVSLGFIEAQLKTSSFIDNICIFGKSGYNNVVAVIGPNVDRIRKLTIDLEISEDTSIEDLCKNSKIVEKVLKEVKNHGKEHGLSKWEIPSAVHLTPLIWTPDNGLVTAAQKLRRKPLENEYKESINKMYDSLS